MFIIINQLQKTFVVVLLTIFYLLTLYMFYVSDPEYSSEHVGKSQTQ